MFVFKVSAGDQIELRSDPYDDDFPNRVCRLPICQPVQRRVTSIKVFFADVFSDLGWFWAQFVALRVSNQHLWVLEDYALSEKLQKC